MDISRKLNLSWIYHRKGNIIQLWKAVFTNNFSGVKTAHMTEQKSKIE